MKFSDYSFVDEEKKVIKPDIIVRDYPRIAQIMMYEGLSKKFFSTLSNVRWNAGENKDYSDDIKEFKEYLKAMEDFEMNTYKNSNLLPIIDAMSNLINRENVGEILNSMSNNDYFNLTQDIKAKVYDVRDMKKGQLTEEERTIFSYIDNGLISACTEPIYHLPLNEVDIVFDKNGIKVNGRESEVSPKKAYVQRRGIFKELDIDKILQDEFGMESPIQRMLVKRKLDPAILAAIKVSNIGNPRLTLFKAGYRSFTKMSDDNIAIKEQLIHKYMSMVLDKPLKDDNESEVSIEYNVNQMKNAETKRHARNAKGKKGFYVYGDVRTRFETLRDKIFGKKLEVVEGEIISDGNTTTSSNNSGNAERVIIDVDTNEVVDAFDLDFSKIKSLEGKKQESSVTDKENPEDFDGPAGDEK